MGDEMEAPPGPEDGGELDQQDNPRQPGTEIQSGGDDCDQVTRAELVDAAGADARKVHREALDTLRELGD